jgi:hypothetical protein
MTERCVRCATPAVVVMSFEYMDATVWLDDLTEHLDPTGAYTMCEAHADSLTPPVGWTLVDRRDQIVQPITLEVA